MKHVLFSDVIGRLQIPQLESNDCLSWPMHTLPFVLDTVQACGCENNCAAGCTCRLAGLPRAGTVPGCACMCSHRLCVWKGQCLAL